MTLMARKQVRSPFSYRDDLTPTHPVLVALISSVRVRFWTLTGFSSFSLDL